MPPVGHTTFGYRSVVSATLRDIYKDRLQVVTLPVPVSILRDAYHDRLIFLKRLAVTGQTGKHRAARTGSYLLLLWPAFNHIRRGGRYLRAGAKG